MTAGMSDFAHAVAFYLLAVALMSCSPDRERISQLTLSEDESVDLQHAFLRTFPSAFNRTDLPYPMIFSCPSGGTIERTSSDSFAWEECAYHWDTIDPDPPWMFTGEAVSDDQTLTANLEVVTSSGRRGVCQYTYDFKIDIARICGLLLDRNPSPDSHPRKLIPEIHPWWAFPADSLELRRLLEWKQTGRW